MKKYHILFKIWVIIVSIGMLGTIMYNVIPQKASPGDPAMTTLMYLSNFKPDVLARDPLYNVPMSVYPKLFLKIRGLFLEIAKEDILLSAKMLFFFELFFTTLSIFLVFYYFSSDFWISIMISFAMTKFVFLPSTITWGFSNLYEVTNRQIFWIFFPLVFIYFTNNIGNRKRIIPLVLVGVLGNSHPGEGINAFIILSVVMLINRFKSEKVIRILSDIVIGGVLFTVAIMPTVGRFFQVGNHIAAVKRPLSSEEINVIYGFSSQITDSNYFWLRFFSHPAIFGILLFIIIKYIYEKHTDVLTPATSLLENSEKLNKLKVAENVALTGMLVVPIASQMIGSVITWGYYALTGSVTFSAALYRNERFFMYFGYFVFFYLLLEIKNSRIFSNFQKYLLLCLSFFAAKSPFYAVTYFPAAEFQYNDFKNLGVAFVLNIAILLFVYFIAGGMLKKNKLKIPAIAVFVILFLFLGAKAERKIIRESANLIKPLQDYKDRNDKRFLISIGEVIEWSKTHTKNGDLFWFDGFDDYVFKAQAFRPTLGAMSTAETPWFVYGDQAGLDNVKRIKALEKILDTADWNALKKVCEEQQVQYVVIDREKHPINDTGYETMFENKKYRVFKTGIPNPKLNVKNN